MNIESIIKNTIKEMITESAIRDAVQVIIENYQDLVDLLSESDELKDLINEYIEDVIKEATGG